MRLFGNMIRVWSEYILRYIRRTGGGIHRYEIGPDMFQVVGVASANSPLCSSIESEAHGSTVLPIIGLSDQTPLTNFLEDTKAWLVYVTIGNMLSPTRNSPVKMPILLLALLPVLPKFTGESARADKAQEQMNADVPPTVFDLHQQNVKTSPGPPRGVMVPLVLLVHPDPPWSTFSVKFQKGWIRMDRSGPHSDIFLMPLSLRHYNRWSQKER